MKKILLSLAIASAAMAANAQIYVLGSGNGLGWDFPGMEVQPKSSGVYEFTVENLTKFKFSTSKASDWDTFNATAYATGNTTFSAAEVTKAGGQTLAIEPWGEDQMVPYEGTYTITINLNDMTMTAYTATQAPTEAAKVYVRGAMNDWGSPATWQFKYDNANDLYWFVCQGETMLGAGVEFKFADANWGSINYTVGGEVKASAEGTKYDLKFNVNDNSFMASDFSGLICLKVQGTTTTYAIFQSGVFEYVPDSGVEAIEEAAGEAAYFDLQGRKVVNPDRGIYVKVQNGKAVKVVK